MNALKSGVLHEHLREEHHVRQHYRRLPGTPQGGC